MKYKLSHLEEVNESYFFHLLQAMQFSLVFLLLSIVAFIHALFPFWFVSTASQWVNRLQSKMNSRLT